MYLKALFILPLIVSCVTVAEKGRFPARGQRFTEDSVDELNLENFGFDKQYDSLKITKSPDELGNQKLKSALLNGVGKTQNKPDYVQPSNEFNGENDRPRSEINEIEDNVLSLSAPKYGSVGGTNSGSSDRSFGEVPHGNNQRDIGGHGGLSSIHSSSSFNNIGYGSQTGPYGNTQGGPTVGYGTPLPNDYSNNAQEAGKPYKFEYHVNEYGNKFGHFQSSDGNQVTGRYYVLLPDGRLQTVDFKADPYSGYTANVKYEGEANLSNNGGSNSYSTGGPNPHNIGALGGVPVGNLPLAFNSQEDFRGGVPGLPTGVYSGPGAFSSKPF